ncbi:DNA ligase D [Microvirga tunisiensis]|uniref:DNA ligase (ATP) n=1 Tax=Microvirga tunisiensis TaxID=2108360 RepID=A0A5N7MP61_9HYPH|nr:DNA ligase D [Microvirga tunisiensis]MPR10459.1 DNA ligase D [Microvirga tunisiensis]MPR28628.1 DNA ligase D [Microvirga tunisiensis]
MVAASSRLKARRTPSRSRSAAKAGPGTLATYQAKRDFSITSEPKAKRAKSQGNRFVVQKHDARRLHYDLRLELDGVLKSWAVTRGPSLVPGEKRLSVHTEDHPLKYIDFEGVIPAGQYGGGTMIVWDQGRWIPEGDPHADYARGRLTFTLEGERLKGKWHLVRTRGKPGERNEQWLLLKSDDEAARTSDDPDILEEETTSLKSGRTIEELAAQGDIRVDHAAREKVARSKSGKSRRPSKVNGAKKGILPAFVEPALAQLVESAPKGGNWLHEIKLDGYRMQARIDGGEVKLLTRKGLDWTAKFKPIANVLKELKIPSALFDGEIVVEDEAGVSSFSALQQELKGGKGERFVYYVFDLLYLDGEDLRKATLADRKAALRLLFDDLPQGGVIRFSDHLEEDGATLVRHACRMGLEGIISKRADQPYRSGRGDDWVKSKCTQRQELVIAGYLPSSAIKKAVGSLVLGVYDAGKLIPVGRVGTGFTAEVAGSLYKALSSMEIKASPFASKLPSAATRGVKWVRPELVAELEFRGWTHDGMLRQGSFQGLREDKDAREVVRETVGHASQVASPMATIPEDAYLTHPDRVLWEDEGITKLGLAEFYTEIADWILPHIVNRPLSLLRCPGGSQKECFFQKHAWAGLDEDLIQRVRVGEDEAVAIQDLSGLLALVQAGVLEIHPWGSTLKNPEKPDRLVFDLDPGEGVGWDAVVQGANDVRDCLQDLDLVSFVKTSGGKGLHVVVPLHPKASWDEAKAFAAGVAAAMTKASPSLYTDTMAKRARTGRIFIDYLRNGRGATAVAAYSTRARAGAPVSTPVAWEELSTIRSGNQYRISNLAGRLPHLQNDPWSEFGNIDQVVPKTKRRR